MSEPSLEDIIAARDRCAQIIALYGERYLPIFERLENEITLREKQKKLLDKALNLGGDFGTQIGTRNGTQIKDGKNRISEIFNKNNMLYL